MAEERDPKVSQRYRELAGDEPSREADQAILAAAHRSLDRPHAPLVVPAGRHRWYYSLGAAAVLMLAIGITIHVERQQPDAELAVPPPAPAPASPEEKPASAAEPPAAQPRRDTAARPMESSQPSMREGQAKQNIEGLKKESRAADMARAPAPMAAESAPVGPRRELERIAELRRQGRDDEADKALAEFRKRYPDYVISDEMKAKVERK